MAVIRLKGGLKSGMSWGWRGAPAPGPLAYCANVVPVGNSYCKSASSHGTNTIGLQRDCDETNR